MTGLDPAALAQLARQSIETGDEEQAAPVLAAAAARAQSNAILWQWTAVLHRALDRHAEALEAYAHAAALAPRDLSIAFGRALTQSEAGGDALPLFEAAARIDSHSSDVILGIASSRFALGEDTRGAADLEAVLTENPGWIAGHQGLARLRYMMGDRAGARASLDRALAAHPREFPLWHALIHMLGQAERHEEMLDTVRRGRAAMGNSVFFDANEAVALSELGEAGKADAMFAKVGDAVAEVGFGVMQVRHLLRTGRVAQALPLIDRWLAVPGQIPLMWSYAAAAWTLTGDPRREWLEGDSRLVSVIDLADRLPSLDRLGELLRSLHLARGAPLDQSVRGGTQTDGLLFTRIDPEIRALRAAIVEAVEAHIAQLPPPDPSHPTLSQRRDRPVRFSGSWSVRLEGGGHHINHVHPAGWFSSALYVSLPEGGEGDAGRLALGQPPAVLGLDLPPARTIEPRPGRLVLFPSTMWHGTLPFAAGERLTVAFDVAPPRWRAPSVQ
ncbi:putative 2OG-Fe(II) oxygenase [Sphingomonas sp. LB-2]|uniref:putative 2OG-Fe(II) oxygenase n=1 Tax=Sphingomonas caeni TaxID=2984949 RepID=UPI0022323E6B|nr:putative 2OG-Fe(II) oxygenase [Sphingomonas caeni]MCW3846961.1 putative 2OG-Fe(II) oxygenase [Sphingomonas caeni]